MAAAEAREDGGVSFFFISSSRSANYPFNSAVSQFSTCPVRYATADDDENDVARCFPHLFIRTENCLI